MNRTISDWRRKRLILPLIITLLHNIICPFYTLAGDYNATIEKSIPSEEFKSSIRKFLKPEELVNPIQQPRTKPLEDVLPQYVSKIREKIYANWKIPLGTEYSKRTVVAFTVFPGGNIDKLALQDSSGMERLDSLAIRAIYDSAPFPKFPEELRESYLHITIHFKLTAEAEGLGQVVKETPSSPEKAKEVEELAQKELKEEVKKKQSMETAELPSELKKMPPVTDVSKAASKAHYNLGLVYYDSKNYQKAIQEFEEAIRTDPRMAAAYFSLGETYFALQNYDNAIFHYKMAIRIDPSYTQAHYHLGLTYRKLQNYPEAILEFKEALRFTPNNSDLHFILAETFFNIEKYQDAIVSFHEAISLGMRGEEVFRRLGSSYLILGHFQEAITAYEEANKIEDPKNTDTLFGLGLAHSALGHSMEAIIDFLAITILDPSLDAAYYFIGLEYRKLQQYEKAVVAFKEALRLNPNQQIYQSSYEDVLRYLTPKIKVTGTGFYIGFPNNLIITNYHVVKNTKNTIVNFLNGNKIKAEVIVKDEDSDVAILKLIKAPDIKTTLTIGDSSKVQMGEKVFTIGYPARELLGQEPKFSEGAINATTGILDDKRYFQISVPVQPGNSGGPLFNERGEIVGIITAMLDNIKAIEFMGSIPQNVNYAIKSDYIKKLMSELATAKDKRTQNELYRPGTTDLKASDNRVNFINKVKNNVVLIESEN